MPCFRRGLQFHVFCAPWEGPHWLSQLQAVYCKESPQHCHFAVVSEAIECMSPMTLLHCAPGAGGVLW